MHLLAAKRASHYVSPSTLTSAAYLFVHQPYRLCLLLLPGTALPAHNMHVFSRLPQELHTVTPVYLPYISCCPLSSATRIFKGQVRHRSFPSPRSLHVHKFAFPYLTRTFQSGNRSGASAYFMPPAAASLRQGLRRQHRNGVKKRHFAQPTSS